MTLKTKLLDLDKYTKDMVGEIIFQLRKEQRSLIHS